jgi:hypothetical protein
MCETVGEVDSMKAYKELDIIFRTGSAIWSKTNFGPIGHLHPRNRSLPHVCTVPSASSIS